MSPAQIKGELHRLETHSAEGVWLLEEGAWSIGPRLLRKALEELSGTDHYFSLSSNVQIVCIYVVLTQLTVALSCSHLLPTLPA